MKYLINKKSKNKANNISKVFIKKYKYSNLKIGIAFDSAFGFYYPDDIDKFKRFGAKIIYFDTLEDKVLPKIFTNLAFMVKHDA